MLSYCIHGWTYLPTTLLVLYEMLKLIFAKENNADPPGGGGGKQFNRLGGEKAAFRIRTLGKSGKLCVCVCVEWGWGCMCERRRARTSCSELTLICYCYHVRPGICEG